MNICLSSFAVVAQIGIHGDVIVASGSTVGFITPSVYFINGVVQNSASTDATVFLGPQLIWEEAGHNSHIDMQIALNNNEEFILPLGNAQVFHPLAIHAAANTAVTARYFDKAPHEFFKTRNFGYYHLMQDEAIEALPYYLESETLLAQISDHYLEANLYNNIGSCYVELSQYNKARVYIEKAVKMAQLSQESYLEAEAMVVLAELAAAEKPSKAYDLHLEATTLLDSLYEIEKVELSKRLIAEYEAEKKDKVLAQQALEIQKRITRNRYVLSATIVLFLLSILLLVVLYQRRKIKNQIEQNLLNEELKNKILKDDFFRLLGEYQLTNTQVIKIKNELRNELNENASGTVSSFYSKIRGNLIINKNNPNSFDMNEVREDFILKLKAQYPSFTHFELLICFYTKLDLTGREIAELTNKTLRSIESHQYRIRKKIRQSSTNVFN